VGTSASRASAALAGSRTGATRVGTTVGIGLKTSESDAAQKLLLATLPLARLNATGALPAKTASSAQANAQSCAASSTNDSNVHREPAQAGAEGGRGSRAGKT
jgi:hypothetical protein